MKGSLLKINNSGTKFFLVLTSILFFLINAKATSYYLSSSGDDSNCGTSPREAWRSLSHLNNFVPKPGDSILFRRGDDWNGTIIVNMWGFEGKPLVYGAYGKGPKPRIYGSEKITGWTKHSGNIYKATLDKKINQLFIGDDKLKAARYPNEGYFFINTTEARDRFTSKKLDPGIDYTGAKWFGRNYYYTTDLKEIVSSKSRTLTLNEAPRKDIKNGSGFFLMNRPEFLDQPGEWYYDEILKTVYLWTPKGDSPEKYNIRGSVYEDGIYVGGKDYIVVQDLEFLQQAFSGINLNKSDYITIHNNSIIYPDGFGIYTPANIVHCQITNNIVTGVNHYGMMLRISHSTVSDNNISRIALFENIGLTGTGEDNYGGGIYLAGKDGNNILKYNRITQTGYNGILFAGPDNIIEYNFIDGACLLKGDMGGIYTSWYNRTTPKGPQGSIIRNNIILNVVGEKYGYTSERHFGEGIYIDRSAKGVIVENNTIAHCSNSGIYLHQTENCIVRKNTIFNARQSIQVVKFSGTEKNHVYDNIMVAGSNKDDYLKRQVFVNFSAGNVLFDRNHYINPYTVDGIFKSGPPYFDFEEWKSFSGQDAHSVINTTPLSSGEKLHLYYNDTKHVKHIDLGSEIYKDSHGKKYTGKISIEPFTSIILSGKQAG